MNIRRLVANVKWVVDGAGNKPYYLPVPRKKPMTCATAGRKRWKGITAEERSALMRAAVLKRWARQREREANEAEAEARAS